MTPQRVVAVTGVSGRWGRAVAAALLAQPGLHVLGIDARPPQRPIHGLDFIKADIRNPLLVELLRAEQVDTVVHLAWRERQRRRDADFESNVLGTMQFLGACVEAGVDQIVLRSTTAVYGARPENPVYLNETFPVAARSSYAAVRDMVEVERFLAEFAAEFPELRIAVLRFANVVGADVDSPFTRLLRLPVIPSLLGFDPLLQLIDFEDAVRALVHTVLTRAGGVVNVAAREIVSLHQAAGMAGKPVLPLLHLAVYWTLPMAGVTPVTRASAPLLAAGAGLPALSLDRQHRADARRSRLRANVDCARGAGALRAGAAGCALRRVQRDASLRRRRPGRSYRRQAKHAITRKRKARQAWKTFQ